MSLGFGLLSAQRRPGEEGWSRAYEETVRLAVEAERLDFSTVWTTEHHFVDDGYMPSLLVVSAALAAVTTRIRIGTGVILAPLHHPVRLAEDAATVDQISKGRLVLGLGLGWIPVEFEGLGADVRKRGKAMEEILQILPQAWSGEPFQHAGEVYSLPRVAVRPTPPGPIPILIGGGAEAAIRRAARLADGIFSNANIEDFIRQLDWLRDECERIGRDPAELRVHHYSVMLPAESEDEGWSRYGRHAWQMTWKYTDMEASAIRSGTPPEAPPFTEELRAKLSRRSFLVGPSERIVETLSEVRERAGVPVEFTARSYFSTLDYSDQVELMERLAAEVAPHL